MANLAMSQDSAPSMDLSALAAFFSNPDFTVPELALLAAQLKAACHVGVVTDRFSSALPVHPLASDHISS